MLKKILTILPYITISSLIVVFFTHIAAAETGGSGGGTSVFSFLGYNLYDLLLQSIATLVNTLQTVASWTLILAGLLLNFSIDLTLHIKSFVDNTPGVYTVWKALRDITGLFIIFFLLYASIKYILGFDAKFGDLIKNIVMAGILINFSFFFAGLGIDASNIISVQLYNAIAPANTLTGSSVGTNGIQSHLGDGGLSDIFMKSLKIPALFSLGGITATGNAVNSSVSSAVTAPFKIILSGVIGIIIMITAALSFGAAAVAFIIRFVVLILLLAFSPIWFASFVAPEVKKKAQTWLDTYKSMLLFMPIYLLLMYFSLTVLTTSPIFGYSSSAVTASATSAATTASNPTSMLVSNADAQTIGSASADTWWGGFITLGINAFMVIFLLDMPLLVAISVGGKAVGLINAKTLGAGNMWKNVGSFTGRNTGGRLAHVAKNSAIMNKVSAWSPSIGTGIQKQLSKIENQGFGVKKGGFKDVQEAQQKSYKAEYARLAKSDPKKATEYYDNLRKGSIIDRMISGAYVASGQAARNARASALKASRSMNKEGNSPVTRATGKVVGNLAESMKPLTDTVKQNFPNQEKAQSAFAMNVAGRKAADIIAKEKKSEETKNAGTEALKAKNEADIQHRKTINDFDRSINRLNNDISEFAKNIEENQGKMFELESELKASRLVMNGANTSAQETALSNIKTALDKLKTDKANAEKEKLRISDEKAEELRKYQEKNLEYTQKISAKRAISEAEGTKSIMDEIGKLKGDLDKGEGK